jgi:hypothetical protein
MTHFPLPNGLLNISRAEKGEETEETLEETKTQTNKQKKIWCSEYHYFYCSKP